jgi:hypothetical protein
VVQDRPGLVGAALDKGPGLGLVAAALVGPAAAQVQGPAMVRAALVLAPGLGMVLVVAAQRAATSDGMPARGLRSSPAGG